MNKCSSCGEEVETLYYGADDVGRCFNYHHRTRIR